MTTLALSPEGAAAVDALRVARERLRAAAPGSADRIDRALDLADAFAAAQRVAATDPPPSARLVEAALELLGPELEAALADEPAWAAHDARMAAQLVAPARSRSLRRRPTAARRSRPGSHPGGP